MAIDFNCSFCSQKLRVSDDHSGKKAKCPKCGADLTVPTSSDNPLGGLGGASTPAPPAPVSSAPLSRWYVQLTDGQKQGPISKTELDDWASQGRLTRECQVLQEGWEQWQWADSLYPALAAPPQASSFAQPVNPSLQSPSSANNPYAASVPASTTGYDVGGYRQTYLKPHRGALILTFGILGLVTCICAWTGLIGLGFSIPAWIMANADLREMSMGTMDRSGEGTTIAGKVLAIIHICLLGLLVVFYVGLFGFMIATGEFK